MKGFKVFVVMLLAVVFSFVTLNVYSADTQQRVVPKSALKTNNVTAVKPAGLIMQSGNSNWTAMLKQLNKKTEKWCSEPYYDAVFTWDGYSSWSSTYCSSTDSETAVYGCQFNGKKFGKAYAGKLCPVGYNYFQWGEYLALPFMYRCDWADNAVTPPSYSELKASGGLKCLDGFKSDLQYTSPNVGPADWFACVLAVTNPPTYNPTDVTKICAKQGAQSLEMPPPEGKENMAAPYNVLYGEFCCSMSE